MNHIKETCSLELDDLFDASMCAHHLSMGISDHINRAIGIAASENFTARTSTRLNRGW